jgi:hypothetical protein
MVHTCPPYLNVTDNDEFTYIKIAICMNTHTVRSTVIFNVTTYPTMVIPRDSVPTNVTVANEGDFSKNLDATIN